MKEDDYLAHYGTPRKSGRYPWGSGGTDIKRNKKFLDDVANLKKEGMEEKDIAKGYGISLKDLRDYKTIARNEIKQDKINQVNRLSEKGLSNGAIGDKMGINESSVRALRAAGEKDKTDILNATADMLQRQVDEKGAVDIGQGTELALPLSDNPSALLGVSSTKFGTAVTMLRAKGYKTHSVKVPVQGTGHFTEIKVLARPDVQWKDLVTDPSKIKLITERTTDRGHTYEPPRPPLNISSKNIKIAYKEDGGATKDGLIEIRPGAKDLDMGKARYAQVRIAVDKTHYLKGMAVVNPDLPVGTDILFNTNKSNKLSKKDVMKPMEKTSDGKIDLENPFGATIKEGGQRGALNILYEAGDWDKWSRNLSSQMLSKQTTRLAETQLNLTHERRRKELDSILELTNPAVKRLLLRSFSDDCDSAAVHLKAAGLPRTANKVLLPINSVKPTEVYSPSHRDGERVALVRHPHSGPFEIPVLTVNNRNPEAKKIIGSNVADAIGIHHKVAEQLSGADFDGDYVLAIPNNRDEVRSSPALHGLKDYDPRASHPPYDGMATIDGGRYNAKTREVDYGGKLPNGARMQHEMGDISNLITDMTIHGASSEEKARAVRHSMVIIDSEKHHLDFKSSAEHNGIKQLKKKYQVDIANTSGDSSRKRGGASTLISKAGQETYVPTRKPRPAKDGGPIDRVTGKKVFVDKGETYVSKKTGKVVTKKFKSKLLAETEDAHTLSSGTPIERLFADHSNRLKAMGNEARKVMVHTKNTPKSESAKKVYAKQVESLESKLRIARLNAPLERQAQAIAASTVAQKRAANPNMDKAMLKKVRRKAEHDARLRMNAKKQRVTIDQEEWNAIQAGAISNHMLEKILANSNLDNVRKLATPRPALAMSSAKTARAKSMLDQGYTQAEVADALGVALSTLKLGLA